VVLSATDEILNLIYQYDEHVDRGRFADAAALFADATVTYEGRNVATTGAAELEAFLHRSDRLYPDGTPRTLRLRTNVIVDVDDDAQAASAFSFFTMFQEAPGFPLQVILAGATRDRLAHDEEGWRFTDRSVEIRLTGDLTAHSVNAR
jgi:SnoaL-like domain